MNIPELSISSGFWPSLVCLCLLVGTALPSRSTDLLNVGKAIVVPGTHGRFDFLTIDAEGRRLLGAHSGNASLDVVDLDRQEVIKVIATGAAQGSAVDLRSKRYFVSVSKPPQLVIIDSATLEVVGKVPLQGPADLVACDPRSGKVYVDHDDGKDLWVIDPVDQKVTGTVALPSDAPEDLVFDASFQRLFQCMKTGSVVAVIDVAAGKVVDSWSTAPAQAPHGMAMLPDAEAFLVAGGNGKLVLMSQKDGHVISSTDIPPKVDQIAYDRDLHRIYCASGTGKIAIVNLEEGNLSTLGEVESSQGCHSIAVDPRTHTVWIAYLKGDSSFIQPFTRAK